jgi:lysophospholipase L1-like esterase
VKVIFIYFCIYFNKDFLQPDNIHTTKEGNQSMATLLARIIAS